MRVQVNLLSRGRTTDFIYDVTRAILHLPLIQAETAVSPESHVPYSSTYILSYEENHLAMQVKLPLHGESEQEAKRFWYHFSLNPY